MARRRKRARNERPGAAGFLVVDKLPGRTSHDVVDAARRWLGWGMGLTFVYGSLLGIGYLVTGRPGSGVLLLALAAAGAAGALAMTRSTVSGSSSVP